MTLTAIALGAWNWVKKTLFDKPIGKSITQTITTSGSHSPVNVAGGDLHIGDKIAINHNAPKATPLGTELTHEAETILREAQENDGYIMFIEAAQGIFIEVNRTNLIPDQSPRTVAFWRGGLKQLQALHLVESTDNYGMSFRVTDLGFRWLG